MKKISLILFTFLLSVSLIGCSKNDNSQEQVKTYSSVSNNNQNMFISEADDSIYWTDNYSIKKISKSDNSVTDVFIQDKNEFKSITAFEYFNGRIYLLMNNEVLLSMDENGQDILEFNLQDKIKNSAQYPVANLYTFDGSLYILSDTDVYHITEKPLGVEIRDNDIRRMYMSKDKTLFIKKLDGDNGRIYTVDSDGKETLFSSPEDKVLINITNFTDSYVFYPSFKDDYSGIDIYRVNIDGSDKTLLKTIPIDDFRNIKYDNFNIYIQTSAGYIKIDKESLKESDIPNTSDLNDFLEPADNKLFSSSWDNMYYIDCTNGEKVDLIDHFE